MDTPRTLSRNEAIAIVRRYKQVISSRYETAPKVIMYGSYAKGYATPLSDIDVAVIVPKIEDGKWLDWSQELVHDGHEVNDLIEPVLLEEHEGSILYDDVMRTGVSV